MAMIPSPIGAFPSTGGTINGNVTVTGTETVSGTLTASSNASVGGNLAVTGNETLTGTLTTSSSATVGGPLAITGALSGATGITVPANTVFAIGGVTTPPSSFLPTDVGFLAWTYDPTTTVNQTATVNGTVYLAQIVLRYPQTISNLTISIAQAAVTPTANQNFLGLYDAAGTRQAVTAAGAIDSATTSTGPLTQAVVTPFAAPAGKYWVALVLNAATPAQLARASGFSSTPNAGTSGATLRWAVNGTAQTSLPATITPASNTGSGNITLWASVS